ncbi:MAG TPA: sigma-70 family RNA polymerase sigma factor [Pirellulales bacterium]|nr:sigma-70 family RNA polymerase sigma factor [Pirellulales bacterium]
MRCRDALAWSRFAALFAPLVFHWVLKTGVHGEDAKDVVQEVFRAVVTRIDDFRRDQPNSTFRGWLFTITRNKLLAHRHHVQCQPQAAGGSTARAVLEQVAEPDLEFTDAEGLGPLCARALTLIRNEFSEASWQAFWRMVVDQQAPADVARELQISVNSAYLAKSRILRRLRQEIGSLD